MTGIGSTRSILHEPHGSSSGGARNPRGSVGGWGQRSSRQQDEDIFTLGEDEGTKVGFGVVRGLNQWELATRRHDKLPKRAAEVNGSAGRCSLVTEGEGGNIWKDGGTR